MAVQTLTCVAVKVAVRAVVQLMVQLVVQPVVQLAVQLAVQPVVQPVALQVSLTLSLDSDFSPRSKRVYFGLSGNFPRARFRNLVLFYVRDTMYIIITAVRVSCIVSVALRPSASA